MLSERNILEQIATIAVVLIVIAGTAWLLMDLAQTPWHPQASAQSHRSHPAQPAAGTWCETHLARCDEICPKAG